MTRIFLINHPKDEPNYGKSKKGDNVIILPNTTNSHRRKFIKRHGYYLKNGKEISGDIYFWGEYEPQTACIIEINQPSIKGNVFPNAIHTCLCPVRNTILPQNALNTDPYVFGDHFKNICCGIGRCKYQPGDLLLFGKIEQHNSSFIMYLDTVMVVKEKVCINPNLNTTQYFKASIEPSGNIYQGYFYKGENYRSNKKYYSYVPCLLDYPSASSSVSLPMPKLDLTTLGFNVNRGYRGWVAKAIPFTHIIWENIIDSIIKQGWLISTHIDKV